MRTWLRTSRARTIATVLLVAVIAGTAMTLAIGTRRTQSAPDRYTAEHGGDPDMLVRQPFGAPLTDQISALPGVRSAGSITLVAAAPVGADGVPILDANAFVGTLDVMGTRVLDGEFADAEAPDEFNVNRAMATRLHATVGDKLQIVTATQEQIDSNDLSAGPLGPSFEATLVGVLTSPTEFADPTAVIAFPTGILRAHPGIGLLASDITIRLDDGVAPADVLATIATLPFGENAFSDAPHVIGDAARDAVRFQSTALWIVTVVAALAAALVVAQVIIRHVRSTSGDLHPLSALGYGRREMVLEGAVKGALIGMSAAILAAVGATLASTLFPLGILRELEPDPGPTLDLTVIALGLTGLVLISTLAAALLGLRARDVARYRARRVTIAERLGRAGATPGQVLGVGFALGRHSRRSTPGWVLVGGTAAGIVGVVGALVVGAGVSRLVDDPARSGRNFDVVVGNPFLPATGDLAAAAATEPDVRELTAATTGALTIAGEDVPVYAFEPVRGDLVPVITSGRLPSSADEIAVGRVIGRRLDLSIGDTVSTALPDGRSTELTVVGLAVTPDEAGEGATMTFAGYALLDPFATKNMIVANIDEDASEDVVTRVRSLSSTPALVNSLATSVRSLERITATPFVLALVLIAFATALLIHSLVDTAAARRGDLAVLRALGAERRLVRGALHWQATALALIAVAIGIPLGIIIGRRVFTWLADRVGLVNEPNVPWLVTLGTVFGVLVVANIAAVWPAIRTSRVDVASELRVS